MKEKKTTDAATKRRNLYFIIIAVCVLLLAAVTVFTVMIATDKPGTNIETPDDGKNPSDNPDDGDDDKDGEDDKPTDTEIVFSLPVQNATVKTTYSFWYNSTLNQYCLHTGIDFAAEAGTEVCAAYSGTVESVTDGLLEGGKIVIDHGDGLKTVYSSIDVKTSLKAGSKVNAGDVIGTVSAETDVMGKEYNEGSHLHFETLENDEYINPTAYLDIEEK